MKKNSFTLLTILIVLVLATTACAAFPLSANAVSRLTSQLPQAAVVQRVIQQQPTAAPTAAPATGGAYPAPAAPVTSAGALSLLNAYQSALENVYSQVAPSVVNIHVVESSAASSDQGNQGSPFGFGSPNQGQPSSQALGSGFVWDKEGHIVTNNHVVSGASKVDVTFQDGTTFSAKIIGTDPSADLAVIQINAPADLLVPVTLANSQSVKVGQIGIAIGNPFGLQGTMTVGIISALGRSISATDGSSTNGTGYSIPDIVQTDAPINPGNSGGVLVNDQGQVVGVTAAIESPVSANAGIGFAIPADIVKQVVPELIKNGRFAHPYLGISGTSLTPDLAKAMNLNANTRGALVADIAQNGPAAKAGLRGSNQQVTIDGQTTAVGGDVITAINGQAIKSMDDLISYLFSHTHAGENVTLTILRGGKSETVQVTLAERPTATQ